MSVHMDSMHMHDIMANSAVDSNIAVTRLIKYTVYKDGIWFEQWF